MSEELDILEKKFKTECDAIKNIGSKNHKSAVERIKVAEERTRLAEATVISIIGGVEDRLDALVKKYNETKKRFTFVVIGQAVCFLALVLVLVLL